MPKDVLTDIVYPMGFVSSLALDEDKGNHVD